MGWLYADGRGIFSYEMAALAAVVALVVLIVWSRHRQSGHIRYLSVKISKEGKELCLHAFVDSGNLLHDPYTGNPVSMVDRELYEANFHPKEPVRLIPYESFGGKHGLLEVVTIETLSCSYEGCDWKIKEPVLGLADHAIFEKKPYQMIINPQELMSCI